MVRIASLALALSLLGCGAGMQGEERADPAADPTVPTESTGVSPSGAGQSGAGQSGPGQSVAACPATFDAARGLGVDCERGHDACDYPTGRCACEIHYRCSGVPPGPGERHTWRQWTCRETPPAVRADGCPGTEPTEGDACDGGASLCTYGECAFTPYRCVGGRWQRGTPSAPPSAQP